MLDNLTVQVVLTHAVRCPSVTAQLDSAGVTGMDFMGKFFSALGPVWDCAVQFYRSQKAAPARYVLEHMVAQMLSTYAVPPDDWQRMMSFINNCYSVPEEELVPLFILRPDGALQQLIDDLKMLPIHQQTSLELDSVRRTELYNKGIQLYNSTRVTTLQHIDVFDPEVARTVTMKSQPSTTNCDFIDKMVDGMWDVSLNGLIAGSGCGKTLTGIQWSMEQVLQQRNTMYLTYEQEVAGDFASRIYTYVGGTTRQMTGRNYDEFDDTLKAKLAAHRDLMNKHFRLMPMAGDAKGQGMGGIPEIETIIDRLWSVEKFEVKNVVIDWLRPLIFKWVSLTRDFKAKDMRERILYVVSQLASLRDRRGVRILLLHQIAPAKFDQLTPASTTNYTMAEDCTSFAQDMDSCISYGKPDPLTGLMWATFSKCRWKGPVPISRIVKLDGSVGRIVDSHSLYTLNPDHRIAGEATFRRIG